MELDGSTSKADDNTRSHHSSKFSQPLLHQASIKMMGDGMRNSCCVRRCQLFSRRRTVLIERIRLKNDMVRHFLAELLGTFIMIVFGCGVVAQSVLSRNQLANMLTINLAWGWAVSMAIWVAGGVSGAHLNPSITLTMVILRKLPIKELPLYWIAQYLGAFIGAACVYGVYQDAFNHFDGGVRSVYGPNATAGIFGTYPQEYISIWSAFGDQILGTAMLMTCVMGINDSRNIGAPNGLAPLAVGGLVTVIGMSLGLNCGYPINPARDLGPRLLSLAAGYGSEVFTAYNSYWWVPVIGPHVGSICGAAVYVLLIGLHMVDEQESIASENQQEITKFGINGNDKVTLNDRAA